MVYIYIYIYIYSSLYVYIYIYIHNLPGAGPSFSRLSLLKTVVFVSCVLLICLAVVSLSVA